MKEFIEKSNQAAAAYLNRRGYEIAIITGGRGRSLEVRLNMLGVKHIYSNCMHKIEALHNLMQKVGVTPEEVLRLIRESFTPLSGLEETSRLTPTSG